MSKKKNIESSGLSVAVRSATGAEVGSIELNPEVFSLAGADHLVHDTVRWQRAKARSGTHQALTRTMMEGGKKKPWKQKHTGRARAGSSVSPLWVGGASIHGPLPRDYDYRLPKRTRRLALSAVLSDKVRQGKFIIVEDLAVPSGKSRDMVKFLQGIGVADVKSAIVSLEKNEFLERAGRNVAKVHVTNVAGVNVYDLMKVDSVVISKTALAGLTARLLGGAVANAGA